MFRSTIVRLQCLTLPEVYKQNISMGPNSCAKFLCKQNSTEKFIFGILTFLGETNLQGSVSLMGAEPED